MSGTLLRSEFTSIGLIIQNYCVNVYDYFPSIDSSESKMLVSELLEINKVNPIITWYFYQGNYVWNCFQYECYIYF